MGQGWKNENFVSIFKSKTSFYRKSTKIKLSLLISFKSRSSMKRFQSIKHKKVSNTKKYQTQKSIKHKKVSNT